MKKIILLLAALLALQTAFSGCLVVARDHDHDHDRDRAHEEGHG